MSLAGEPLLPAMAGIATDEKLRLHPTATIPPSDGQYILTAVKSFRAIMFKSPRGEKRLQALVTQGQLLGLSRT